MTDWVPESQTVNQKHYLEVTTKHWECVRKESPELWKKKSDFASKQCTISYHPHCEEIFSRYMHSSAQTLPYSQDLVPKVKSVLKGTHFQSVNEVKLKTSDLLNRVSPAGLLWTMENLYAAIYSYGGRVSWRGQKSICKTLKLADFSHLSHYITASPHK
jgi:hypothetical protein